MKNDSYWKKRFEDLEASEHKGSTISIQSLESHYTKAQRDIEGKIESWYQRFATNNQISMAEARKFLSSKELKEFKWDVKEYIKYGQENEVNQLWMKELENASARYHISRLEALKVQTQQSLEVLYGNQLDELDAHMKHAYSEGYYHTLYELQKGFNIGWDIASIDQRKLKNIISKPWVADGRNFSSRVWDNKNKLVNELHNELTQMTILGRSPDEAIRNISKKMNTSKTNAGRLVMTESAYFSSQSQKDAFNDLDVEQYEILATLDSRTSAICQELDGKVFDMKDHEAGVTAPPFHVLCRTTTVPFFDDEFNIGERAARDEETGQTYYVPSNITYPQWKEKFVDKISKDGLKPMTPGDIVKVVKEKVKMEVSNFPAEFQKGAEGKNTQKLVDYVNDLEGADPNVLEVYNNVGKMENISSNGIPFKISHAQSHSVSYTYRRGGDLVEVKYTIPKLEGDDLAGQVNTILHEQMHLMDMYNRKDPSKYGQWLSTEQTSLVDTIKDTKASMSDDVEDLFKKHNEEFKKINRGITDSHQDEIKKLKSKFFGEDKSVYSDFKAYKAYEKESKKLQTKIKKQRDYASRNAMGGGIGNLQDIYDALSGGSYRDSGIVKYGHGSKYYSSLESKVHEIVANYGSLSVTRPDLVKLLKDDKPELVEELEKYIQVMLERVMTNE